MLLGDVSRGPHVLEPMRVIQSAAPIRICDNGGWTDTWFAKRGCVFNIAVDPCVHVELRARPDATTRARVTIDAENYGERYVRIPEQRTWDRHPLIEATLAHLGVPPSWSCEVRIHSAAPAGASTGTSAALTVSLIGALSRLAHREVSAEGAARAAHTIETDVLHQQSGIQDQVAAAYGGINFIEIDYPAARVSRLDVPGTMRDELQRRLLLLYLGRGHRSSTVHDAVIRRVEAREDEAPVLDDLRQAALRARDAVLGGDLDALGRAMQENTDAQARLHPDLVSRDARRTIEIARCHGATGWKVNGAGGEGGSLTILCGRDPASGEALRHALHAALPSSRAIPIRLNQTGLIVRELAERTS
jgi:D-glycero-alpha-D-manno-heptose-7-phosphate kinase